jgi:hypothetical protein
MPAPGLLMNARNLRDGARRFRLCWRRDPRPAHIIGCGPANNDDRDPLTETRSEREWAPPKRGPFKVRVTGGAHPRTCGEKCRPLRGTPQFSGTPPRMRGEVPSIAWNATIFGTPPPMQGEVRSSHPLFSLQPPRVRGSSAILTRDP